MITVISYWFWSDNTENKKYTVDETQIFGFELHYRGDDSWHIKVCVKEKQKCAKSKTNPEGWYHPDYELSHCVPYNEVIKFINNSLVHLLKIVNYHNSVDFDQKLLKLYKDVLLFQSQDKNKEGKQA
jgi:hypothetical protein